ILNTVAAEHKTTATVYLLERLNGANQSGNKSAAAVLAKMLPAQPQADLAKAKDQLKALAAANNPAEVRQPALAAVIAAEGTFDDAWKQAAKDPARVDDVLSAVPLVFDQDLRETMYDRVKALLAPQMPADVVGKMATQPGVK